jgi:carboxyl-terminal processing protease
MRTFLHRYKTALLIGSTALVTLVSMAFVDDYFEVSKNLDIFSTLYREVNMYYVDSTDPGKLMKKGIDSMLESLDPYTNYIPESEIEDYRFMTTGQYGGIGALIRQNGDYVQISDPYEGFPAQQADLRAGDIILEIDGKSAKGKKTDEVSRALKGSPNTDVRLLIRREGEAEPILKTLTRKEIKVKSVPYAGRIGNDIGYIRLNSFTENAGGDVGDALKRLKQGGELKGLILDLRGNPGGLLNEAVNISNLFVERGQEIVSTRGKIRDMDKSYKAQNSALEPNLPVAVLVNSGSASASEIVSGSLQDLDRAVIVGQRTFGKGLVQTTRPLSYNAQLKITTAKYYIPSGRCIQVLDYSHRNEDGSVGKIPDSLTHEFRTKAGRIVRDGGGILPDVIAPNEKLSNIAQSLLSKNLIFDYATKYRRSHASVPSAREFRLGDEDFADFEAFLKDKDYDYVTRSEKTLEDLRKVAEEESYLAGVQREYEELKVKLSHDKQNDLRKNKAEILELLQEEIASRYYFQVGRIEAALQHDPQLNEAEHLLRDASRYRGILNGTIRAEAK